ncbi:MAG: 50S ribosomal protein L18 [Christensenellales bacterium]|jgi:large subunit ribosomal protein L18
MIHQKDKNAMRQKRHMRVRSKLHGTPERPRLCVYRSSKHIYAQIIDDDSAVTLVSASTVEPALREKARELKKTDAAAMVGQAAAQRALEKGIACVVFDRGGYLYHGRIAALARGARDAGLKL